MEFKTTAHRTSFRAPQVLAPKKDGSVGRVLAWIALVVLLSLTAIFAFGDSTNSDVVTACKANPSQFGKILDSWRTLDVIKRIGNYEIVVDDTTWENISHDAKVSIAISYYCQRMDSAGRAMIYVRGYRDGKRRATVLDGHYSD